MLSETIKTRRSVFPAQYTGGEIEQQHLHSILESARWAPNHKITQPWRYKVLLGKAIDSLADFLVSKYQGTNAFKKFKLRKLREDIPRASAIVLIFMYRDKKESVPEWEELAATAMSVQNMWLTAHDLGYGAYWSSPKSFAPIEEFQLIRLNEQEQFLGFFHIGTYNRLEQETPERMMIEEFTEFIE